MPDTVYTIHDYPGPGYATPTRDAEVAEHWSREGYTVTAETGAGR